MLTLLVRHASCASCGPVLAGRTPGIDLDAEGEQQAAALGAALARERLTAVYTSPLARAVQTAQAVGAPHGLVPIARERLLEMDYGEWTGKRFDELEGDARWRSYNTSRSTGVAPGGESAQGLQARVVAELLSLRERHAGECIVLVTHAEVVRVAAAFCLGVPLDLSLRIAVAPASVTRIGWLADGVEVAGINWVAESG